MKGIIFVPIFRASSNLLEQGSKHHSRCHGRHQDRYVTFAKPILANPRIPISCCEIVGGALLRNSACTFILSAMESACSSRSGGCLYLMLSNCLDNAMCILLSGRPHYVFLRSSTLDASPGLGLS